MCTCILCIQDDNCSNIVSDEGCKDCFNTLSPLEESTHLLLVVILSDNIADDL